MQITIAPSAFDRWSELLALLRSSFEYMNGQIDPPSSLDRMNEAELKTKAIKERLIIAEHQGRLIGCAYADIRSECVYVGKVAVDELHRGQGVARKLFNAAESIAIQSDLLLLQLQTRVELTQNHQVFGALGFEKVAETAHSGYLRPTSITMQRRVKMSERAPYSASIPPSSTAPRQTEETGTPS
jgi:N-acetylglutamate synthase-like GNAT family acetyltransferase